MKEARCDCVMKLYQSYLKDPLKQLCKEEMTSIMSLQDRLIKSMGRMYIVLYYANFVNDSFIELACMKGFESLFGAVTRSSEAMKIVLEQLICPEFRVAAAEFMDLHTLPDRLMLDEPLSMDYQTITSGWCRGRIIPVTRDKQGRATTALFVVKPIQAQKEAMDAMRRRAEVDGLTQITNRLCGAEKIDQYLSHGCKGMFCMFDVDHFKHYNDHYGHDVGDMILQAIGACMKESLREADLIFRIGGDEFGFFAQGITDPEKGEKLIGRLIEGIQELRFEQFDESISISLGQVFFDGCNYPNFDKIFKAADILMYENKRKKQKTRSLRLANSTNHT